jgi:hypothetical protein
MLPFLAQGFEMRPPLSTLWLMPLFCMELLTSEDEEENLLGMLLLYCARTWILDPTRRALGCLAGQKAWALEGRRPFWYVSLGM